MASVSPLNFVSVDKLGALPASPPSIIRENMAMGRDDRIGVRMLDESISHWWDWHNTNGGVPTWQYFKPFDHPEILSHVMVYKLEGDRFRCTIVGETAANHLPIKVARQFIDEVMPPENLQDISKRLRGALEAGVPNFVEKTMAWERGYDLVSYRALQLPFVADEDQNPRVVSVMDFRAEQVSGLALD